MSFAEVIGLLGLEDVDDLVAIEEACFPIPWSRESIVRELLYNRVASYVGYKVEGRLVGYAGIWIIADEGHITNLAVLPDYRRQGIGSSVLEALIDLARRANVLLLTLEVRRSNQVAQRLYLKTGFRMVGVRKQYYSDNLEDALVMVKLMEAGGANHG